MSNIRLASNKSKQTPVSQLNSGNAAVDAERLPWAWLLVIAPGRLVTFVSPHPLAEVEQRLHKQPPVKWISPHHLAITLPHAHTERRFFAWIETDQAGRCRLHGQTRTPYRAAVTRLVIGIVLSGMALMFLAGAHAWLAFMFAAGGVGFLLLSQYERLTGRDIRMYAQWLRQTVDAERL